MQAKSGNTKVFVIDTNVLIHNPDSINSFRNTEIVIPLIVLEELDKLKTWPDHRGRSAREAIRALDATIKGGDVHTGVKLDNGSILRVPFEKIDYDRLQDEFPDLSFDKNDNRIILLAYSMQKKGKTVFFVSKDINARVKANAMGLKVVDYEKQKVDAARLYQGFCEAEIETGEFDSFLANGEGPWKQSLHHNEYVHVTEKDGERQFLARWNQSNSRLVIVDENSHAFGIRPNNIRQAAAIDLLMDDSIRCVTLVGRAGTGKTLLALAAGLRLTLDEHQYDRILVSRPIVPLGKDIGFLPGEKIAKLSNWMQPIFDNFDYLFSNNKKAGTRSVDQLIHDRVLEVEAVTFIRGRSLPNQYILIDEAQNLTPHEVRTIVSRAGENSKVVLTGDPQQIDNMYLDANSNGLSYLVDAFKGQHIFGHITMTKTERSELAQLAADLL